MRTLKTKGFCKSAEVQGLTDEILKEAGEEVRHGLAGDALGGGLFKKRVAVGSKGKSGGLRTILAYKAASGDVFCLYMFAKNVRENIEVYELRALKKLGQEYLNMTELQIIKAIGSGVLIEVYGDLR